MIPYQIKVNTFKPSGKHYERNYCEYSGRHVTLSEEHRELHGSDLLKLIEKNAPEVQQYACVGSGFKGGFRHMVEVTYPVHVQNYCLYMIDDVSNGE